MNKELYYKTSDLALCAALCCNGYAVNNIDKKNPKRAIFWIKNNNNLDKIIKSYWSRELTVEPMAFFNILKELKARIYNS
ncbi:hypothetical protein A3H09_02095 [Candidatus Falkowbacteria bacterium RIFCSPLOWO2_12_FULL_45_13]|uniref:DUF5659 domain-containing protein n=1 Tax=Candidatus Falkowbacteria bacterium RIFCSPLOWO2_12_FULL_45_13 TaxID=1797991 RepID=A0A1F5SV83_9BACT|nr:MAG: hypothetical protein A3H09_02095 [Candidatus Falkowbacteria bacterium RIFCSPLOWO2_12_FULL_45_13]